MPIINGKYVAKRVSVLEVGAGHKPHGIVGQAKRALKKRFGRTFVASDIVADGKAAAREFGLFDIPHNAKVLRECSFKTLEETPSQSRDIVMASFFLNGLYGKIMNTAKSAKEGEKMIDEVTETFFREAKRVTKKGGRIILISPLADEKSIEQSARKHGLAFYSRFLTDTEKDRSFAEYVQKRANHHDRQMFTVRDRLLGYEPTKKQKQILKKYGLRRYEDLEIPTLISLKVPRK